MSSWQRRARLGIAVSAALFAVVVAFALKRRDPVPLALPPSAERGALVEVTGGRVERFSLSRQDVRVAYERLLTFADRSTKLMGVTVTADARAGGRSFTIVGREADVGQDESTLHLTGDVRLTASDGLTVQAESAHYAGQLVRAGGPVTFSRGRLTGSGVGLTYDTEREVMTILDRSVVRIAPDERGAGSADVASGSTILDLRGKTVRFERNVRLTRARQIIDTDVATGYLSPDEKEIERLELRGGSKITMTTPSRGGVEHLAGQEVDLEYGAGGEAIERVVIRGNGAIQTAGTARTAGHRIQANHLDITLAPDGATPLALTGRESVALTLPAQQSAPQRVIEAAAMDATGEAGRGLTRARFTGDVELRERGAGIDRQVESPVLDAVLEPVTGDIQDARFSMGVHVADGDMTGDAAEARYDLNRGTLQLTGSNPRTPVPRVVNSRLTVDATRIDITLSGPDLDAAGAVKSVLRPRTGSTPGAPASEATRVPSMFSEREPINVASDALHYSGTARTATYTGSSQLWQDETSLKAETIVLGDRTGDLSASGGVTTVTVRERMENQKTGRARTIATATEFRYEEATRRATYLGDAHLNSPDGDVTASTIELYLKATGSDLERAEAYDNVTLRDRNRTTTGARLTFTTSDERYHVSGTPVRIVDECRRETVGRTLTYVKSTATVTIDGNEQTRTATKGSAQCP